MAYNNRKIFPIDLKHSTAVGVSVPYNGNAVFVSTYQTKDAIRSNLLNFFLTNKKERYMNGNFGFNFRNYLFEAINSNNIEHIQEDMQTILSQKFKTIKIINLEIDQNQDENSFAVKLSYSILNSIIPEPTLELTI